MAQRKARYNQMAEARRAEQAALFDETLIWNGDEYVGSQPTTAASVKGMKTFLLNTTGIDR